MVFFGFVVVGGGLCIIAIFVKKIYWYMMFINRKRNMYFIEIGYYNKLLYFIIFLLFLLTFTQVFYFILGCELILITWTWHYIVPYYSWPWSVLWPMLLNGLDRNSCIATDPRRKDYVYINFFYCTCYVSLKTIYVIFFAMY